MKYFGELRVGTNVLKVHGGKGENCSRYSTSKMCSDIIAFNRGLKKILHI